MDAVASRSRYVGNPEPSRRGAAQVSGQVSYADDYVFPGQLYAHFIRSPHAAARINTVDFSGARRVHGVVAMLDGKQAAEELAPVPHPVNPALAGGLDLSYPCLAIDSVNYEGQPVAIIVAEDRESAIDAASRVRIDYDTVRAVVEIEDALAEDAVMVAQGAETNVLVGLPLADGDCDAMFARAAHVVEARVGIHRFSTQPIETRVYNAVWDGEDRMITLYATTQSPHTLRHILAQALQMPENRVRVIAPLNGGSFGLKMHAHPEEAILCHLARKIRRPVKWVETREECLLYGSREQVHDIALALDADGKMLALRDHFSANVGAPAPNLGWCMAMVSALTLPGPYDISDIDIDVKAVLTNKAPWNSARGYGKESAAIALEFIVDKAARQIGMDPVELRMRNFIPADRFPVKRPTGVVYDSGDYSGALNKALATVDYDALRKRQKELREKGRYIGIGIAYEVAPEGGTFPGTFAIGYDSSTVKMDASGRVTVSTGVTDPGTGNATGIAQMVADELGIRLDDVRVVQGDTETCPFGGGNFSSRSLVLGGAAAVSAAQEVRGKLEQVAARLMDVPQDELRIEDGVFVAKSTSRKLSLGEVAFAIYTHNNDDIASFVTPPLEATGTCRSSSLSHTPDEKGRLNGYATFANGAYVVTVEVDPDTGVVSVTDLAVAHDCGKVINPLLVEGQISGAIAMGLGGMMSEHQVYSEKGKMLTRSFTDYVMPRALDLPNMEIFHHDCPSPHTPHGAKGAGESGVGGSLAALVNAVNDAIAPFDVEIAQFPLTAPAVWQAIQTGKRAASAGAGEPV